MIWHMRHAITNLTNVALTDAALCKEHALSMHKESFDHVSRYFYSGIVSIILLSLLTEVVGRFFFRTEKDIQNKKAKRFAGASVSFILAGIFLLPVILALQQNRYCQRPNVLDAILQSINRWPISEEIAREAGANLYPIITHIENAVALVSEASSSASSVYTSSSTSSDRRLITTTTRINGARRSDDPSRTRSMG